MHGPKIIIEIPVSHFQSFPKSSTISMLDGTINTNPVSAQKHKFLNVVRPPSDAQ
jgi:hypothetical protein